MKAQENASRAGTTFGLVHDKGESGEVEFAASLLSDSIVDAYDEGGVDAIEEALRTALRALNGPEGDGG